VVTNGAATGLGCNNKQLVRVAVVFLKVADLPFSFSIRNNITYLAAGDPLGGDRISPPTPTPLLLSCCIPKWT
jgi:hypothetical protein